MPRGLGFRACQSQSVASQNGCSICSKTYNFAFCLTQTIQVRQSQRSDLRKRQRRGVERARHKERLAETERRYESAAAPPTFISVQENVFDRRLCIELGQEQIFKRDSDFQLYVRADHRNPEGQAPLCYVATGYKGDPAPDSEPHQGYMVYNESDLRWARRLKFHLRRLQA